MVCNFNARDYFISVAYNFVLLERVEIWNRKRYLEANIILAFTLYSICENMYSALFLNLGLILACYYLNNEVKQYG